MAASLRFPPAETVGLDWVKRAGCSPHPVVDAPIDFDRAAAGPETVVSRYGECATKGVEIEMWKMRGSPHVPRPIKFGETTLAFLRAHPKP
jgi:hypothetical protein